MFSQLQSTPRRMILEAIRSVAGRWHSGRTLTAPPRPATSARPTVLVLGIYLADRPHTASHLTKRFASTASYHVSQRWVALNGEPDSEELARVTVERAQGRVPKFSLLNRLLSGLDWSVYDYILVADDDITVPRGFLDSYLGYQVKFDLALAQPARTLWSRASHPFVRQCLTSEARLTRFVEIGPVFSIRRDLAPVLLPFDEESPMGWGYDLVWPVQTEGVGLRMGIVDAAPVDHSMRGQAVEYSESAEQRAMDAFLKRRPHLTIRQATVVAERLGPRRGWLQALRQMPGASGNR